MLYCRYVLGHAHARAQFVNAFRSEALLLMPFLRLLLLGSPQIERDGLPVRVDRHKSTALLAYIAISRQRHSRDGLAALLWPDFSQSKALASLRRTLAALKKDIGEEWLEVDRDLIGFMPGVDLRSDVEDMQHYLAECRTHGHPSTDVCQSLPDTIECGSQSVAWRLHDGLQSFRLPHL